MDAQSIIDEVSEEMERRFNYDKIDNLLLQRLNEKGIELYWN